MLHIIIDIMVIYLNITQYLMCTRDVKQHTVYYNRIGTLIKLKSYKCYVNSFVLFF